MSCEMNERILDAVVLDVDAMGLGDVFAKLNPDNLDKLNGFDPLGDASLEDFAKDLLIEQLYGEELERGI